MIARLTPYLPYAKRLAACLFGAVVLAAMWSPVEGSNTDFYFELKKTERFPRLWTFLIIGVAVFLLITFWRYVVPYLGRPGVKPAFTGFGAVAAAYLFMHWNDNVGTAKFSDVANAVSKTGGLPWITTAYFGWLHWTLAIGCLVLCLLATVLRLRAIGWVAAALAVFGAIATYYVHSNVNDRAGGNDHSLGYAVAIIGYLILAGAGAAIALARVDFARSRQFVNRVMGWRPGLVPAVIGAVVGVLAFTVARWYAPERLNTTLSDTHDRFKSVGLNSLAVTYLGWMCWLLLVVGTLVVAAAAVLRLPIIGWVGAAIGALGCVLTVFTMYKMSSLAARLVPTDGTTWQNLGTGGWMAAGAFLLLAGGGVVVATAQRGKGSRTQGGTYFAAPGAVQTVILIALAFAIFYPPTMTTFWQQVLVTEIGPYLLLAVGLNVVVGWAGLLDLGYIAFFAVGAYSTAYITGSLPVKPPSWLVLPSLAAIPVAIAFCVVAGLLLGAPTLRLRGDYLAIVTLGFGEIIQLVANNGDDIGGKNITNGSRGTAVDPIDHSNNVPHPSIHIGGLRITWGINQLQYWYLLLIYLIILVILFRRLEHSRVGRAWAAVREDEVAAEASGVNTFRLKLLAFAIGASSSGVAGVFYASQVGYFSPTDFTLVFSILVVAYVVFGGMGSLAGALAGAAALTWLPRFLQDQVPPADKQMWIGAIVVLMMIFRPEGLVPARRRRIELEGFDEGPPAEPLALARAGSLGGAP